MVIFTKVRVCWESGNIYIRGGQEGVFTNDIHRDTKLKYMRRIWHFFRSAHVGTKVGKAARIENLLHMGISTDKIGTNEACMFIV